MWTNLYFSKQQHKNYIPPCYRWYKTQAGAKNAKYWDRFLTSDIYVKTINLDKRHYSVLLTEADIESWYRRVAVTFDYEPTPVSGPGDF